MDFIYNKDKADKLIRDRSIDLKEIEEILLTTGPVTVIQNPARRGQKIFLVCYKGYIHAVPFVRDAKRNYILKTAYKSRKYNKIYGGSNETQI